MNDTSRIARRQLFEALCEHAQVPTALTGSEMSRAMKQAVKQGMSASDLDTMTTSIMSYTNALRPAGTLR